MVQGLNCTIFLYENLNPIKSVYIYNTCRIIFVLERCYVKIVQKIRDMGKILQFLCYSNVYGKMQMNCI